MALENLSIKPADVVTVPAMEGSQLPPPKPHVRFLDGLRAAACLMVLASHTYTLCLHRYGWYNRADVRGSWFVSLTRIFNHAHYAVAIFIVLSGFLLMLPVAKTPTLSFTDGLAGFFRRRIRRIAPAYYAALLLFLAMTMGMYAMKGGKVLSSDDAGYAEATSAGSIVSHMLLLHNIHEGWVRGVDSPMWSVAAEAQIYVLFALLLLPVTRRWGWGAALALAALIGYLPVFFDDGTAWQWPSTQYVTLFAFGMTGAMAIHARPDQPILTKLRDQTRWALIALVAGSGVLVLLQFMQWQRVEHYEALIDGLVGITTIALIMGCSRAVAGSNVKYAAVPMPVVRFLSSPFMVWLAGFSYSLYLLHKPILIRIANVLRSKGFSAPATLAIELLVAVPLVMVFAWSFHLIFERPFMPRPDPAKIATLPAWQRWLLSRRLLPQHMAT
jgi:peptidoglycan/LPS O-acetylase OafA/YrhL